MENHFQNRMSALQCFKYGGSNADTEALQRSNPGLYRSFRCMSVNLLDFCQFIMLKYIGPNDAIVTSFYSDVAEKEAYNATDNDLRAALQLLELEYQPHILRVFAVAGVSYNYFILSQIELETETE